MVVLNIQLLAVEAVLAPNHWMQFQLDPNSVVNSYMVVLLEGTMKRHTTPHMAAIQCSKGKLVFVDWTAQIDTVVKDQLAETQHKKFQILFQKNKQE